MRISDDPGNAAKLRKVLRSALRVTAGNHDARGGIRAMNFAHGVARLRIGGGGYGAGVQHHDVSGGVLVEQRPDRAQRSARRIAAASASVARQPKFSSEKVAMRSSKLHSRENAGAKIIAVK